MLMAASNIELYQGRIAGPRTSIDPDLLMCRRRAMGSGVDAFRGEQKMNDSVRWLKCVRKCPRWPLPQRASGECAIRQSLD
jgi:hypothetical protein